MSVAGAPVSSFFETKAAVPLPPVVSTAPLPAAGTAGEGGAARQMVSEHSVGINGRRLTLSVMREGSAGVAVLSAAGTSAVPVLPAIAEAQLRDVIRSASGCRVDGALRQVAGRQGTLAISAGLDCSGV
ncbi:hypothetical protein [Leisingera sp. JC1]|uniref:hypothetical protein n=1 Tax=Leisingera sp. JC1 TaxID=1855282 RepID=UPI000803AB12|nr:hypothetical protein [Leisingera sp. JC1]OBY25492.1 hypothetical protein A9D60_22125 [Leisingera sp. JC1]